MMVRANVEIIFLRSMALVVAISGIVLANAEEALWPSGLTPTVAIVTYFLVDRRKQFRLSVLGANILGLIAFVAMSVEFYGSDLVGKLLSGAHLLVYMTWVVLLLQKGIRQFWWLLALSTLQVSVASVLTTNPGFGALLALTLLVMIWTLSVFTLYRAQLRLQGAGRFVEDSLQSRSHFADATSVVEVKHGLQLDADEHWIGYRFCGIVAFAFVSSLGIGIIAFAVFPRLWVAQSPLSGMPSVQGAMVHQTGFTETVQLGEIGQIMQSDRRVLQLEVTRMDVGVPVSPERFAQAMNMDEILFRGNALGCYSRGRWTSGSNQGTTVGDLVDRNAFDPSPKHSDFRIRIHQDPPIATFAFAPMPFTNAFHREGRGKIKQRNLSYSLVHRQMSEKLRQEPLTYEIWCAVPPRGQKFHTPGRYTTQHIATEMPTDTSDLWVRRQAALMIRREANENRYAHECCITRELSATLPNLQRLAVSICSENGRLVPERNRIDRILTHLSTPGVYQYSLTADVHDADMDPIEDFLFNRRSGHCEYFASAGALMLQAVGIPARVVNGYKGCEMNSLSGRWEVQQKHAHTWLEAYVERRWETLDPTPAAPRGERVRQSGALDWWTDLKVVCSDSWFQLIQKMTLQRQEAFIRPLLMSLKNGVETIRRQGLWASLKIFVDEVLLQPKKWFSWQTGVITFIVLLFLALAAQRRPDRWLGLRIRKLTRWLRPAERRSLSVVRFYETFCSQCAKHGLPFPKHQTAQENAAMAAAHFDRYLRTEDARNLPRRIAGSFNQVRFGERTLSAAAIQSVRNDVVRFTQALNEPADTVQSRPHEML